MKVRNPLLVLALVTGLSVFGIACNTADDDTAGTAENDTYGNTGTTGTTGSTGTTTDTYGTTGSTGTTTDTTGTGSMTGTTGTPMNDDQIEDQLNQQFDNDPALKDIDVDADNGTITLSGTVKTKEDLTRAEQMVRQMGGVSNVKIDTVEVDSEHENN